MPVIVVGADAPPGPAIIDAVSERGGEVRAFVTDIEAAHRFKQPGVKVAVGDVSDASHVGAAMDGAFTAVFIAAAGTDRRERAFAADAAAVFVAWEEAVRSARPRRIIWVGTAATAPEGLTGDDSSFRAIDPETPDVGDVVAAWDDTAELRPDTS